MSLFSKSSGHPWSSKSSLATVQGGGVSVTMQNSGSHTTCARALVLAKADASARPGIRTFARILIFRLLSEARSPSRTQCGSAAAWPG